ncbi:MAG: TetR/AcrR family transcriptional regulator [Eubacteriaceae bacterium]|nr:TetR/AcrR family transcriptional regulator [Eubacteriaceae bacterium]
MNTKGRIAREALTLFSEKGYNGTTVKNIAEAVGIRDSSLYKHYKSKQDILDSIMAEIGKRMDEMSADFGLPAGDYSKETADFYEDVTEERLVDFSRKIFMFYLKDDLLSKFWRMGASEQFRSGQVSFMFRKFFYEDSIKYQTALFAEMVNRKIFIEADPEMVAVKFYAPVFFLLSKYSGCSRAKEKEALAVLEKQVREFYRVYKA